MRELRMSGSVRGVPSNGHPYRDPRVLMVKSSVARQIAPPSMCAVRAYRRRCWAWSPLAGGEGGGNWQDLTLDPRRIALAWFELPYSTFKRLALFAANQDGCVDPEQWCEWLVADAAWWLWSVETRRETMRLLVVQGAKLTPSSSSR